MVLRNILGVRVDVCQSRLFLSHLIESLRYLFGRESARQTISESEHLAKRF